MTASYITMVRAELSDVEVPEALLPDGSFVSVDCAFLPVDSIADEGLAALLREGDAAGFFEQLPSIVTFPGFEPAEVRIF